MLEPRNIAVMRLPAVVCGEPVKVPFFDDRGSYGHAVLGLLCSFLPGKFEAAIVLGFTFYQMLEVEPIANKLGDFGEFATGQLLGQVLRPARRGSA